MERKVALQIRNTEPIEEVAKAMANGGFKYVSMAFGDEAPLLKSDWESYVMKIDQILKKYKLKCIQTHAPYYGLLISAEKRDENMEASLIRSVEVTRMLGADICAVHPRSFIIPDMPRDTAVDREKSLKENIISFNPLVELCEKYDLLLGIENLMRYPHVHPYFYSWIAEDHRDLIDAFHSKNVAAIWDFGHANLVDTDHADRIRTLGNRIKGTHVHNNDGKEDNHLPPFLPPRDAYYVRKSVDWDSVMTALKDTGFTDYLTLETVLNLDYPFSAYVRYLYESLCVLDDMLHK